MTISTKSAKRFQAAATGLQKVLEKNKLARSAKPRFSAFFQNQKTITLQRFKKLESHFREEEAPAKLSKVIPIPALIDGWDGIWDGIAEDTFDDLQELVISVESNGLVKGALQLKNIIPDVDPTITFSLKNPRAVKWFTENGGSLKYIKDIQDTTRDQLQTVITKALDEGWSYGQTAKEMSGTFDEFSRDRAQRIAVHETGNAYEAGNRMFADSLTDDGIKMEKMWQRSGDERDCEECIANEEEGWIPIGETHRTGDQQPLAHNGCRCFEIYRERGQG